MQYCSVRTQCRCTAQPRSNYLHIKHLCICFGNRRQYIAAVFMSLSEPAWHRDFGNVTCFSPPSCQASQELLLRVEVFCFGQSSSVASLHHLQVCRGRTFKSDLRVFCVELVDIHLRRPELAFHMCAIPLRMCLDHGLSTAHPECILQIKSSAAIQTAGPLTTANAKHCSRLCPTALVD